MKKILFIVFVVTMNCLSASFADEAGGRFSVNMERLDLQSVLDMYHQMSGRELVVSSQVKLMHPAITVRSSSMLPKGEALKLIAKALVEQAAVVVSQLDDKRDSVTFNDALLPTRPKTK